MDTGDNLFAYSTSAFPIKDSCYIKINLLIKRPATAHWHNAIETVQETA